MRETLERLEAHDLHPRAPRRNPDAPHDQIGQTEQRDGADNHDRATPMQQHLVEIIPRPSGGLNQHARLGIGNIDASLGARELLQQRLFVGDTCGWIGRSIRGQFLSGRRYSHCNRQQRYGDHHEASAHQKSHAGRAPSISTRAPTKRAGLDFDAFVVSRHPAPGTRAVAALQNALLVNLGDDFAVACQ
jgi:hypothetical protein